MPFRSRAAVTLAVLALATVAHAESRQLTPVDVLVPGHEVTVPFEDADGSGRLTFFVARGPAGDEFVHLDMETRVDDRLVVEFSGPIAAYKGLLVVAMDERGRSWPLDPITGQWLMTNPALVLDAGDTSAPDTAASETGISPQACRLFGLTVPFMPTGDDCGYSCQVTPEGCVRVVVNCSTDLPDGWEEICIQAFIVCLTSNGPSVTADGEEFCFFDPPPWAN